MHGWSNRVVWWAFARQYAEPCERAGGFSTNQGIFAADAVAHTRAVKRAWRLPRSRYCPQCSHESAVPSGSVSVRIAGSCATEKDEQGVSVKTAS